MSVIAADCPSRVSPLPKSRMLREAPLAAISSPVSVGDEVVSLDEFNDRVGWRKPP